MKKLISGFDELNVYTKDSQDAGSSFVNPFENVNVNQEWIEKLTKLGEKLRPIFEWLQKALSDLFNWISEHIGLVLGLIGTIMAIGLIAKIGEIIRNLKVVWDLLKVVGEAIMTFLTSPLGGVVLIIAGLVTAVAAFVDMWKNGWNIIGEILKDLGIALVAIGAIILGAPAAITALIAGIVAALSTLVIVVHEHWDEIVAWTKQLWKSLGELWEKIKVDCVDLWNRLGSWLSEKWSSLVTGVKDKWTQMKTAASELTHALGEALAKDWETIKSNLGNMWNSIKSMAASVWQGISTTVINIVHALGNALQSAWNGIKSFTQSIWNGITGVIKGAINGIIGLINGMIRGLTNGINAVINLLNKFSVTIPSWVPGFGGKHFGFNLRTLTAPQIPTLANGGVITAPTLAMMGEYAGANRNPEIATPQRLLENIIDKRNSELVSSFAEMTNQIISAISDVNMEVKIGDETIARSAARGNDNYFRLTGSPLFV